HAERAAGPGPGGERAGPPRGGPQKKRRRSPADRGGMAAAANGSDSKRWEEWYRLARYALACSHNEAVQYANLRFVEEQNRDTLRAARLEDRRRVEPRPAY